jgi:hypothetical protein
MDNMVNQSNGKPLVSNKSLEAIRFEVPSQPVFPILGSILSILSLMFMSGLSLYLFLQLIHPGKMGAGLWNIPMIPAGSEIAAWVWIPFLFTIFGGTLGWVFELGLLFNGTPFEQHLNRFTTFIQRIRFLNLAPVVTSLFFFVCAMVIPEPNLRMALLFVAVFACFGLAIALYFAVSPAVPLIILGTQVAQFIIVIASDMPVGGRTVAILLMIQSVLQATAFIITALTPLKSTAFHVISTISGLLAYWAIAIATNANPDFSREVAPVIPAGSLLTWGLVVVAIAGLIFTMKASPMTYNSWRAGVSNSIWSVIYFFLISQKRFPCPLNLSEAYKEPPPPSKLEPYYLRHPEFLPEALSIPAVERIEGSVTALEKGRLVVKVKKMFKIIALMDHIFPQADINTPLKDKPRMKIWSNGFDVYPQLFLKRIFGYTLPIPQLKTTPPPAIDAFKQGQLLAYLAEYGVANPFLKLAPDRDNGTLVMDFRFLEKYETKADYESYGGKAYFRVNSDKKKLELISVVAPDSEEEIAANPMYSTFRHAESIIVASMYFQVISGKHLAGIHMIYNLLEVIFHNAFDAQGQYMHPFRTFMYLHLFSHELAEELTTEHLVQEGAVFSQVFATTHDALINHLNDCYHNFEYGDDEDFESRMKIMKMDNGEVLPDACINWEMKYVEVWQKYTDDLMTIIYGEDGEQADAAVRNDKYLQDVYRGLNELLMTELPARYDKFQTKKGVSRWASDTIHHLVIRHQVYGTSGERAAMDPRISSPQIPKDLGTPGVDEWRSLLSVGLATACARFTLLVGEDGENFTYLLDGVDEKYKDRMAKVFEELQENLLALEREWKADREYNYDFFRPTPSDLRTGAGY